MISPGIQIPLPWKSAVVSVSRLMTIKGVCADIGMVFRGVLGEKTPCV